MPLVIGNSRGGKITKPTPLDNATSRPADQAAPTLRLVSEATEPQNGKFDSALPLLRVVVVDDETLICDVLAEQFQTRGHEVACFTRPEAALAQLQQRSADVILCDMLMPEMDGMEFYRRLVAWSPALAARTIFIMGDRASPRMREFFTFTGCFSIEKPFRHVALEACILQLFLRLGLSPVKEQRQPKAA